jgi:hypothetical protein
MSWQDYDLQKHKALIKCPFLGVISQSVVHLFTQALYTTLWLAGVHYKKYMTCKTIYQLPKDSSNMNPNDKVNMIYLV